MSRYIDADALVKRLKHSPLFLGTQMQFKDGVIDLVEKQPTADVVEVRHGEWVVITEECDTVCGKVKLQHKECSVCGYPMGLCGSLYCGNCGAKMDDERRSENEG